MMLDIRDRDWHKFQGGQTIGKRGSENGTILVDEEHLRGARITLEQECGAIPFAITLGIYGSLFHTHFENDLEKSNEYFQKSKYLIKEILELHNTPERERDESWRTHLNLSITQLVGMDELSNQEEKTVPNVSLSPTPRFWWNKLLSQIKSKYKS